jgi:hypothetical protein
MNEEQLQELLELLGPESGLDIDSLRSVVEGEGVEILFSALPEGAFNSKEEFGVYFDTLKKKDPSDLPSMGSNIQTDPFAVSLDYDVTDPKGVRYGANVQAPEKNTWLEEQLGKNVVTDFFGDIWRAGAQGMKQGATIDDARRLFIQGSSTSEEDVDDYIRAVQNMDDVGMSDEMRSFNNIYEANGGGILGFVLGLGANPTVIAQLFVSSIASMVNPDVVGIAVGAAGAGALAGAGAGAAAGSLGGPIGSAIAGRVSAI